MAMRISLPIVSLLLVAAAEGRSAELNAQSLRTETRENIFRAGLNYRFGGPNVNYIATPVANWSGLYVGGNFGGSSAARKRTTATLGATTDTFNLAPDGWLGGGQIGYNFQAGNWVLGAEADFQGTTLKDDRTTVLLTTTRYNEKMPWFGTVRGRVGYAWDRFLPYFTGGLALGDVKARRNGFAGSSDTNAGWTVGVGSSQCSARGPRSVASRWGNRRRTRWRPGWRPVARCSPGRTPTSRRYCANRFARASSSA